MDGCPSDKPILEHDKRTTIPAHDSFVGAQSTPMVPPGGDGGEPAYGRVGLAPVVVAPALGGSCGSEHARMVAACGDGGEPAYGRVQRAAPALGGSCLANLPTPPLARFRERSSTIAQQQAEGRSKPGTAINRARPAGRIRCYPSIGLLLRW